MPSPSLSEDSPFLPSGYRFGVVLAKQVPLCRTDHKMTFPGRAGPRTIFPQLPKSLVATFMLTTAPGGRGSIYVHSTVGQAETYSPKEAQGESGEHRRLGKMKLKGQGLQTLQAGAPLCWAGLFSPTMEATGPDLPHLGPWR